VSLAPGASRARVPHQRLVQQLQELLHAYLRRGPALRHRICCCCCGGGGRLAAAARTAAAMCACCRARCGPWAIVPQRQPLYARIKLLLAAAVRRWLRALWAGQRAIAFRQAFSAR
jgi:hypothetical protein